MESIGFRIALSSVINLALCLMMMRIVDSQSTKVLRFYQIWMWTSIVLVALSLIGIVWTFGMGR